jgi:hypothetical protein
MEKKQTAVTKIFYEIKAARGDKKFWNDTMLVDWLLESEERLKQMEEDQILDAHIHAQFIVVEAKREFAEKYYNDFYGKTK